MSNTAPLPKETVERIEKEAPAYSGYHTIRQHYIKGRIDEATRAQPLVEALEHILLLSDWDNQQECVSNLALEAINKYNSQP